MRKTLVRLAISILAISTLILASGTAFGIENQANDTGNATVTATETETPSVTEVPTPEITEAVPAITEATPVITEATPEKTEATPEKTEATPEQTTKPVKSPGFESIFTIATIIAAICMLGTKRR